MGTDRCVRPGDAFHLAIPARTWTRHRLLRRGLGCKLARRYDDRITLDFFGDQLVCHLSEKIDAGPSCIRATSG